MAEVSSAKRERSQIEWRRNKVHQLLVRGYNQYEIADTLKISQPTISRDLDFLRKRAHQDLQTSDSYSTEVTRGISLMSFWNERGIKVELADC
jgi:DNA-binding transcriptional regulator LsrR (DeoR family)